LRSYKKQKKEKINTTRQQPAGENYGFLYNVLNAVFQFFVRLFKEKPKKKKNAAPPPGAKTFPREALEDLSAKFGTPLSKETLKKQLDDLNEKWNKIFIDPQSYFPDWKQLSFPEKEKKRKLLKNEIAKRKKSSREKIDNAVNKAYTNFDLKGISETELENHSRQLASKFRERDIAPLANYIKNYIVYINTK